MVIIIMGVAGAGKTTVGRLLAEKTGFTFVDADNYHSAENKRKMASGIPLTDQDRAPWLQLLADSIREWLATGQNVVLACSALKERYRAELLVSEDVRLVHLQGSFELIRGRLQHRHDHYMPADLLGSQFAALEPPSDALAIDAALPPEESVREIRAGLQLK